MGQRVDVLVVGGGATGLGVADGLSQHGRSVAVLERSSTLGGLAAPWTLPVAGGEVQWDRFYHVVLSSDHRVIRLLARLGIAPTFETTSSEMLQRGAVLPFSTPVDLVRLPSLRPLDRVRVAATIGFGGLLPTTQSAVTATSSQWLRRWSGKRGYEVLWEPLLRAKLGSHAESASSVFIRSSFQRLLRARLTGGTGDRFGWFDGGYRAAFAAWSEHLTSAEVHLRVGEPVQRISRSGDEWIVVPSSGREVRARSVVIATPGPVAAELLAQVDPGLPMTRRLREIEYLGVVCASVVLDRPATGGYLTYVTDDTPYTAIVEMTRLTGPAALGGHHLVYLPKYASPSDPIFGEDVDVVGERFVADFVDRYPGLTRDAVIGVRTASARHVMPVPAVGRVPGRLGVRSGIRGLYVGSSAHVDDGTLNIESSLRVAEKVVEAVVHDDAHKV